MNLHARFVQLGRQKNSITRELCALLPEIDRQKIYKQYGFGSIYEYAWTLAGMSTGIVKKALNLDRKLENKPELKKLIIKEGIHKLDLVAKVATPENQEIWAKKVTDMSKNGLQQLVKEVKGTHREELRVAMNEETERLFRKFKKSHGGNLSNRLALEKFLKKFVELKKEVRELKSVLKKLEEPRKEVMERKHVLEKLEEPKKQVRALKRVFKKLENPKNKMKTRKQNFSPGRNRHIPAAIKRKAGDECIYPDCKNPRDVFHHRERYAAGGGHESVVALCNVHHEFAHNGLIKNETGQPDGWELDLGGNNSWADRKYLVLKRS